MARERGCKEITIVWILVTVVQIHALCVLYDGVVQFKKFEKFYSGAGADVSVSRQHHPLIFVILGTLL